MSDKFKMLPICSNASFVNRGFEIERFYQAHHTDSSIWREVLRKYLQEVVIFQ